MIKYNLYLAGYKGFKVLQLSYKKKFFINSVYTYKSAVNKKYSQDIINFCRRNNVAIKILNIKDVKIHTCDDKIKSFFIGWQFLIHNTKNAYVFHDSLLPSYSGFSPTVSALINGENNIGITLFLPDKKIDNGKIIYQKKIIIKYPIKIIKVYEILSREITKAISIISIKNKHRKINSKYKKTYSIWRDENDYFINWKQENSSVERFINALGYPYDCAKTRYNGKIIKIKDCNIIKGIRYVNYHPGKICSIEDNKPVVMTNNGLIKIKSATYLNNKTIKFKQTRKKFL